MHTHFRTTENNSVIIKTKFGQKGDCCLVLNARGKRIFQISLSSSCYFNMTRIIFHFYGRLPDWTHITMINGGWYWQDDPGVEVIKDVSTLFLCKVFLCIFGLFNVWLSLLYVQSVVSFMEVQYQMYSSKKNNDKQCLKKKTDSEATGPPRRS